MGVEYPNSDTDLNSSKQTRYQIQQKISVSVLFSSLVSLLFRLNKGNLYIYRIHLATEVELHFELTSSYNEVTVTEVVG
jgi:hypothetical protein